MSATFTATSIAVDKSGKLEANASTKALMKAASVHVLAFSSQGDLLLAESEGSFDIDQWEKVYAEAKSICYKDRTAGGDDAMEQDDKAQNLQSFMEDALEERVQKARNWKASV